MFLEIYVKGKKFFLLVALLCFCVRSFKPLSRILTCDNLQHVGVRGGAEI